MFKHNFDYYLKFVLVFVIIFFVITYTFTHKETISKEAQIITTGSMLFAKTTTFQLFDLNFERKPLINSETQRIELLIFEQINEIRKENNIQALKWDPLLADIANEHSFDMAQNLYLNHTDLKGRDPTKRAIDRGINVRYRLGGKIYYGIGENIGYMPRGIVSDVGILILPEDIAAAMVLQWLLSEPHKENILDDDYYYTGIGVVYDGLGNFYITQNFQ